MTKDNTISLGDAMKKFFKQERLDKTFNEKKVVSIWSEIMGEMIANRTIDLYVKNKTLFVTLSSAPLKQELNHAKSKVIELVNKKMEAEVITDVRFK